MIVEKEYPVRFREGARSDASPAHHTPRTRVTTFTLNQNEWVREEQRQWNAVMYPARRKLTTHSLPATASERRKKILTAIEKQKIKEFTDGWANLRTFLNH
jgi:hypothetical protein